MNSIVLQPMGIGSGHEHTIFEGIDLHDLYSRGMLNSSELSNEENYKRIKELYRDQPVRVWGIKPTQSEKVKNDINLTKWSKISQGDIVLLKSKKKLYTHKAIVTYKMNSKGLAEELWGNVDGVTWEHIYFVSELEQIQITEYDFNKIVGYSENNILQGFTILDKEKSEKFINKYDLTSVQGLTNEEVALEDLKKEISISDEKLERITEVKTRVEQSKLRKNFFTGKSKDECTICGQQMPVEFLVVGHLKKRSLCSDDEKRDLNNVTPMCRFGCDELFERGYFGIENGDIVINRGKSDSKKVVEYLEKIEGRTVRNWKKESEKYYNFHRKFHNI